MHQTDDNGGLEQSGLLRRLKQKPAKQAGDAPSSAVSAEQTLFSNIQSGSGEAADGMGSSNPFENWRVEKSSPATSAEQTPARTKTTRGLGSITWHTISSVILAGLIAASLFSFWMPASFIPGGLNRQVADAISADNLVEQTEIAEGTLPAGFPTNRIGIVVGHRGHDSGAVCANGLTELEINSNVATYVQQKLIKAGYEVDLLDEFDSRLANYQAGLILSIHSDSCDYINDSATGFKVAAAFSQREDKGSTRLVDCVADRYAKVTGLRYHYQSVTTDMTNYHIFDEINPYTTAGIIELGFMNLDQEILVSKPELLAEGIYQGIACFMNNEAAQRP